jgi:hypothetical protein
MTSCSRYHASTALLSLVACQTAVWMSVGTLAGRMAGRDPGEAMTAWVVAILMAGSHHYLGHPAEVSR